MEVVQSPRPADIQAEASVEKYGHVVIDGHLSILQGSLLKLVDLLVSAKIAHRDRFRKIAHLEISSRHQHHNFNSSNSAANLSRW
jgi:hypothetical protein